MANFGQIIGGALAGWGDAIAEQAKEKREMALQQAQYEHEDNDIAGVTTDVQGNVVGYTRGGQAKPLGIRAPVKQDEIVGRPFQDARGNWYGLTKAGRVVPTNVQGKAPGSDQPLVEIQDPNNPNGTIYVPRSQAIGKPGKPTAQSPSDVIAPILAKLAAGKPLSTGEKKALSLYEKTGPTRLTADAAITQARKDYEAYKQQDKDNNGTGVVYNADGSVADPYKWITNRAARYTDGTLDLPSTDASGSQPSAPPSAPAASSNPASPSIPPIPSSLAGKTGLQWSPSRKLFRDSTGQLFDANGNPAQ